MSSLSLWLLLSSFFIFGCAGEIYPTNFMETFRWKSKEIHYGIPGRINDTEFRTFVSDAINKFTDTFGNYFTWIFEENSENLKKYERYMVFDKRILQFDDACDKSWWPNTVKVFNEAMLRGQNTISIAVLRYNDKKIVCKTHNVIQFILATLGFYPLTSRIDREKHLHFQWYRKNIFPEFTPKRFDLSNSTNPIFEVFDFASIHMPDPRALDHNVASWPLLYVPLNNSTENWNKLLGPHKNATETDVQQFQAIYHD